MANMMPDIKTDMRADMMADMKNGHHTALEELKPQLTTLNHIKHNCDILLRDVLPEEKSHSHSEHEVR